VRQEKSGREIVYHLDVLDGGWKSFVLPNLKSTAEAFRKAMS
jgi:hypothetical protein